MTTYDYDTNATGANNGTSMTDAYQTLAAAVGSKVSGDIILVDKLSNEAVSAGVTLALDAIGDQLGLLVKSVDKSNGNAFSAGAKIRPAGNTINITATWVGIDFDNSALANTLTLAGASPEQYLEQCILRKQPAQYIGVSGARTVLVDATIYLGTAFSKEFSLTNGDLILIRPVFIGTPNVGFAGSLIDTTGSASGNVVVEIYAADLSIFEALLDSAAGSGNGKISLLLVGCKLPSSFFYDITFTKLPRRRCEIMLIDCDYGTQTLPVARKELHQHAGWFKTNTTIYRNGGGTYGGVPICFELQAHANRTWKQTHHCVRSIPFGDVVATGPTVITVRVAHNGVGAGAAGALQDDEFWVEIEGPDNSSPATALHYTASSRCAWGGTPADLAADATSAWTGSSIATHQKISLSYTPALAGPVIVRAYYAPQSGSDKVVYIDPKVSL